MSGNAIAVIAKPIVEIATLASEKLRSRNSRSGTQRLAACCAACHSTNTAEHDAAPATISSGTEMNPVMVPQS